MNRGILAVVCAAAVALTIFPVSPAGAVVVDVIPSQMIAADAGTEFRATPQFLGSNSTDPNHVAIFYAPLTLPVGATITKVVLYYQGDPQGETWLFLRRAKIMTGSSDDTDQVLAHVSNLTTSQPGVIAAILPFTPGAVQVVQKGWTYYLMLQLESNAPQFYGAKVTYTPAP